jgi:hypothetical protein
MEAPVNWYLISGAGAAIAALFIWAQAERLEVYRKDAQLAEAASDLKDSQAAAEANAKSAETWKAAAELAADDARKQREAADAASERAADAEAAAIDAGRTAEREVIRYVQDIARIPMPCGLVRVLDNAADDTDRAGGADRRAELSAAAGCRDKADSALSGLGFDRLVGGFLWLAEDRRKARARAGEMSRWFEAHWRAAEAAP